MQRIVELHSIITHLFILVLTTKNSPDSWEHFIITPIHKCDPHTSFSDHIDQSLLH
jgi:hypothetical protein